MDGSLSVGEFKSSCLNLIEVWATHCSDLPPWRWQDCKAFPFMPCDKMHADGYLVLEDMFVEDACLCEERLCSDTVLITEVTPSTEDNGVTDVSTVTHGSLPTKKGHFFTYHIVYNEVFKVPKLYLKGRFADGQSIEFKDLQDMLPVEAMKGTTQWTYLTYEEHPYLRVPWLALHPCGTSALMSMIMLPQLATSSGGSSELEILACSDLYPKQAYILTWLSVVSQAVALKLPQGFLKSFIKRVAPVPEEPFAC